MIAPVALITGARGIAAATAKRLAERGWSTFIVALEQHEWDTLVTELDQLGTPVGNHADDLRAPGFTEAVVQSCHEQLGRIDALFNVAGGSVRAAGDGPAMKGSASGFDAALELNLSTQFRMCSAVATLMLAQPPRDGARSRGVLLNMGSVLGLRPAARHFDAVGYATAKGALVAMTKSLAVQFAPERIRCNLGCVSSSSAVSTQTATAGSDAQLPLHLRVAHELRLHRGRALHVHRR